MRIWTLSSLSSTMSTVALIAAPSAQRSARKRTTASRMVFGRQGFDRYPSHPASRARSSSHAVSAMIGIIGRLRVRLEPACALPTVHPRHAEIHHDQVGTVPARERQGGPAVVRLEGLVALAGQDLDHDTAVVRVVLGNQYALCHPAALPERVPFGGSCERRAAAGKSRRGKPEDPR